MPDLESDLDDDIGDEMLRHVFTACHPKLSREARARIMLPMIPLTGLESDEGYRAISFLCWIPNLVAVEIWLRTLGWDARPQGSPYSIK